jgi:hypothetical protein
MRRERSLLPGNPAFQIHQAQYILELTRGIVDFSARERGPFPFVTEGKRVSCAWYRQYKITRKLKYNFVLEEYLNDCSGCVRAYDFMIQKADHEPMPCS